jgi:transcription-repair coupling factor (superfamily II helicase)
LKAEKIGITRIDAGPAGGSIEFSVDTKVDHMFIFGLIQQQPKIYKMDGNNKLKFALVSEDAKSRFILITTMLNELANHLRA